MASNEDNSAKKRIYFTPALDIELLKEIINLDAYSTGEWEQVSENISILHKDLTRLSDRTCKERAERLVAAFKKDDLQKLNKSGTDEEYTDRERLLQDVADLSTKNKTTPKKQMKPKEVANTIRQRAMSGLKENRTKEAEGQESDSDNDRTPVKRRKVQRGRGKDADVLNYLTEKNHSEIEYKKRELDLKEKEIQLQREQWEAEKKEREQRLQIEKEDKQMMLELMRSALINK